MYYKELDEEEKRKAAGGGSIAQEEEDEQEDDDDEDFLGDKVVKPKVKNVASCLARLRQRVLRGCSIVFSGVIPRGTGVDARRSDYGIMAEAMGAMVTEGLSELTTHLVAENHTTEKVYHASRKPNVHIVTLRWLQLSYYHCQRKKEKDYLLMAREEVAAKKSKQEEAGGEEERQEKKPTGDGEKTSDGPNGKGIPNTMATTTITPATASEEGSIEEYNEDGEELGEYREEAGEGDEDDDNDIVDYGEDPEEEDE